MPAVNKAMAKGKILKVKLGYNPNSSSIGTLLIAFPAALLASSAVFAAVAAVLLAKKESSNPDPEKTPVPRT